MARKRVNKRSSKASVFPKMQLSFINKYNALMSVSVQHDFFNSGNFPTLKIKPTNTTLELLQRNNMQFREQGSGFLLGYAESDAYSPVRDMKKPLQLSFTLELADATVYNYTDIPFEFDDTIYYFNNKALEKDETEYRNLSNERYVTGDDRLDILPPMFDHDFDEPQEAGVEVQVVNASEEVVFEQEVTEGHSNIHINLAREPEGKYTLLVDGLEEYSFYLYTALKKIFGAIDIIIDRNEIGEYSFYDGEGNVKLQEYNIHFKARKVRWKYIFIENNIERQHQDHQIQDVLRKNSSNAIKFLEAEEEESLDGRSVYSVWTEEPIPFKQSQLYQFKMKSKRGKNGIDWVTDLPNASPKDDLKVNSLDKDEVYSELIVYL